MDMYRLRLDSCIGTIIDVHKTVGDKYENQEFLSQFKKLKQAIERLDISLVREQDVLMVEQATNALLGEFKPIFELEEFRPVYEQYIN